MTRAALLSHRAGKGELKLRELVRTNDIVLVSAVGALLDGANIHHLVLDQNMSIIEGSLGVLPRRILVHEGDTRAGRPVPATVPGTTPTDLLAAGLIAAPYLGLTATEVAWSHRRHGRFERGLDLALAKPEPRADSGFRGLATAGPAAPR